MSTGKVSYTKEMREEAKRKGKCLYTVQTCWDNGRNRITVQGYATDEEIQEIEDVIHEQMKRRKQS